MPRPIAESVVVVTGATSGIGRSLARGFAKRGAKLALAARSADELDVVARECERLGTEAISVPTDVADADAVEELAVRVERRFGGIDTWVNNAGVIAYGEFERIPPDVFRRVVEVNFFGQVHGTRAALPRLRRRGGGVLISLSSVWGRITTPLVSPYVVSKHAVRALGECVRHELDPGDDIHVVTVLPEAVDTPIFDHAANYVGQRVRPMPPMFHADDVAAGIIECVEEPKREITYGRAGRMLEILYSLAPSLYCRIAPAIFMRGSFADERVERGPGNVLEPRAPHRVPGAWRNGRRRELARAALAAGAGLALGLAGRGSRAKP